MARFRKCTLFKTKICSISEGSWSKLSQSRRPSSISVPTKQTNKNSAQLKSLKINILQKRGLWRRRALNSGEV
jgi:hypothetical protein